MFFFSLFWKLVFMILKDHSSCSKHVLLDFLDSKSDYFYSIFEISKFCFQNRINYFENKVFNEASLHDLRNGTIVRDSYSYN